MFDEIIKEAEQSLYDFQTGAFPFDPLSHLFADWVPYYKLKWAIASVLKPESILEIGVRYGYSAKAFLSACPQARFLGIDLDADTHGGTKGAIEWARSSLSGFDAQLMISDTQQMKSLPGGFYDLIHVDGQQDGDGTFRDLLLASKQAKFILVDGYLWTRLNFLAINEFLFRNASNIEYFGVIPGYAGELLIKVKQDNQKEACENDVTSSLSLQQAYTAQYYLTDCGGYDSWRKGKGKLLEDARLRTMAHLAGLRDPQRLLDAGCGRGEIAYHFAQNGSEVTAVDYSSEAIELAKQCFAGEPELMRQVEFKCEDICSVLLEKEYDVVTSF